MHQPSDGNEARLPLFNRQRPTLAVLDVFTDCVKLLEGHQLPRPRGDLHLGRPGRAEGRLAKHQQVSVVLPQLGDDVLKRLHPNLHGIFNARLYLMAEILATRAVPEVNAIRPKLIGSLKGNLIAERRLKTVGDAELE